MKYATRVFIDGHFGTHITQDDLNNDYTSESPLELACRHYNIDVFIDLLELGAFPDDFITDTINPRLILHCCDMDNARFEFIKPLIEHGAKVNVKNNEGNTPLILISSTNQFYCPNSNDIIESLINAGAKLDVQGSHGDTALIKACEYECERNVEVLIKFGADIRIKNNDGKTALYYAEQNKNDKIIKLLTNLD